MERTIRLLAASVPVLGTLASCSRNAVEPSVSSQPDFLRVASSGPAGQGQDLIGDAGRGVLRSCTVQPTIDVRALTGGIVTAGRYTVMIPAGALKSEAGTSGW